MRSSSGLIATLGLVVDTIRSPPSEISRGLTVCGWRPGRSVVAGAGPALSRSCAGTLPRGVPALRL
ncbi:hypothetical protein F750_4326 [Streptomyces sp. PAMC 26508]|nr:hypothetical protein F750_4326 [Streptomyces sp. PAMC 26508]